MATADGTFIIDKEELKPGLIIFRRSDVKHSNWYCRIKVITDDRPKSQREALSEDVKQKYKDKYKTVSLKTADKATARQLAFDEAGDVRYAVRHGVALFNRTFQQVSREFYALQEARCQRGKITEKRLLQIKSILEGPLDEHVGSTQVHLIGDDLWAGFPIWRRETGEGLIERNGSRMVSKEIATKMATTRFDRIRKSQVARGIRPKVTTPAQFDAAVQERIEKPVPFLGDDSLRKEMVVFASVMKFAVESRYLYPTKRFDELPSFNTMRREAFTIEEYRKLHTVGRAWMKEATTEFSAWHAS